MDSLLVEEVSNIQSFRSLWRRVVFYEYGITNNKQNHQEAILLQDLGNRTEFQFPTRIASLLFNLCKYAGISIPGWCTFVCTMSPKRLLSISLQVKIEVYEFETGSQRKKSQKQKLEDMAFNRGGGVDSAKGRCMCVCMCVEFSLLLYWRLAKFL